jgi:hypothetical protein
LAASCTITAGLLHWSPDRMPRRRPPGSLPAKPLLGQPVAADLKHAGAGGSGQRGIKGCPAPRRAGARPGTGLGLATCS